MIYNDKTTKRTNNCETLKPIILVPKSRKLQAMKSNRYLGSFMPHSQPIEPVTQDTK